jgi:hypothetical protein
MRAYWTACGVAACLLAATGCGGSGGPTGAVSGSVTYKGQPLTQGEVSFYSKDKGVGAMAKLDATGKYKFDQPLAAGVYAVTVLPAPPEAAAPGTAPKAPPVGVPRKYQDPVGSGLSYTVKDGDNDYPIVLKD